MGASTSSAPSASVTKPGITSSTPPRKPSTPSSAARPGARRSDTAADTRSTAVRPWTRSTCMPSSEVPSSSTTAGSHPMASPTSMKTNTSRTGHAIRTRTNISTAYAGQAVEHDGPALSARRSVPWRLYEYPTMRDFVHAERPGAGGMPRTAGEVREEGSTLVIDPQLKDHSPRPVGFGDVDLDAAGQGGAVSGLGGAAVEPIGHHPVGGELVAFSAGERASGVRRGVLEILSKRGVVELDAEARVGTGCGGHL